MTVILRLAATSLLVAGFAGAQASAPDFVREVRPILARHCFTCHGPDDAARKGGLRLDERDAALQPTKSGHVALVPGDLAASELVRRIRAVDDDVRMPPPGAHQALSAADRDVLVAWIAAGAEYRPHWAFVPPQPQVVPPVRAAQWPRNAIDHFVLAGLERAGLQPAAEADRWTLVRRVHLDLIGPPPTPEAAREFVEDRRPDAYERLVDRLLAMPQYGERWARRWLDLARYADTNGYEKDRERSIWPWRDQVVRALNADQPFDQFTIEQLAGDMLPEATPEQIVATGFHRNTMLNEEGGIDPLEFRFHAMTDRVATTGTAWLGLSLGCAQCHTHKFDPIPQRDYYAVMACLDNADEVEFALPDAGAAARAASDRARAAQLLAALPQQFPLEPATWHIAEAPQATARGSVPPQGLADGSLRFAAPGGERESYTIAFEVPLPEVALLRLEVLTDDALPAHGPGHAPNGNFVLTALRIEAGPRGASTGLQPVAVASARADAEQRDFAVGGCLDDDARSGWAIDTGDARRNAPHTAVFAFARPVAHAGGSRFVVTLQQDYGARHTIGRLRLAVGALPAGAVEPAVAARAACEQAFAAWRSKAAAAVVPWTALRPHAATSNLPLLTVQPDDSVFASGDITKSDTYELRCAAPSPGITALRLEALPDDRLPGRGPGMGYYEGPAGDFFLGEFEVFADGRRLAFARASEDHGKNAFGGAARAAQAIDGDPQTGWSTADRPGERHTAVFVLQEPLADARELTVRMAFGRHYACSLGRFRLSATTHQGGAVANDLPADVEALLAGDAAADADGALFQHFLRTAPELAFARRELQALEALPARTTTLVLRERGPGNPRTTHLRRRGEFLQPLQAVAPGALGAIAPFPAGLPRNRLGLARWIASPQNPLTARVAVNRAWQAFFGQGLVRSLGDFGYQGDPPTHPELLDWLAVEFVRGGWSHKRLHRLIATSATYRQAARVDAAQRARDPDNRLLGRGARVRLDAEVLRDSVLRASGLLSLRMGGRGVHPPQPAGVTEIGFGKPQWPVSQGEDRYRRSLYTFHKRTTPFALLQTFDAPSGEACLARREAATTPLQALTLLNDVLVVEASRALGALLAAQPGTDAERLQVAFQRCVTRPMEAGEGATLLAFVAAQRARFAAGELDAAAIAGPGADDRAAVATWALLARVLFNLDEFLTRR